MVVFRFMLLALPLAAIGQTPDPAWAALDRAFSAVRAGKYEEAVGHFEAARTAAPSRASIYKDLAYTLLKIGETEQARDRFGDAMRLDPADIHVALEYAFLCHETKQQAAARRIFLKLSQKSPVARQAFRNIDNALQAGIDRLSRAIELSPGNFSAHQELARLAEQRDDLELAARHFEHAWRLRAHLADLLLDLGRVWKQLDQAEKANAALLAASRGTQPRAAEEARELLPERYPFVYEFKNALLLTPNSIPLRRELAYLHLQMGNKGEAETEFRRLVEDDSKDLLSAAQLGFLLLNRHDNAAAMPLLKRVLASADDDLADRVREALGIPRALKKRSSEARRPAIDARQMAEKSIEAGYLKDALKYLKIAHEHDPADFQVMLKLGWLHNVMKDDRSAIEWFRLASKSSDEAIAAEAKRAYSSLRPSLARFRTSAWLFPIYSSRWQDLFSYGQIKAEYGIRRTLRIYASARLSGDIRGNTTASFSGLPVQLSENAMIFGGGVSAGPWKGVMLWAEAGTAIRYLSGTQSRTQPDVRGGISYSKSFGPGLLSERSGISFETTADFLYISRFDRDSILYWQNRTGYTVAPFHTQLYWNMNLVRDVKGLSWARTMEQGPGIRFRFAPLPKSVFFTVDALSGRYNVPVDAVPKRHYRDFRVGLWYAFSH